MNNTQFTALTAEEMTNIDGGNIYWDIAKIIIKTAVDIVINSKKPYGCF